MEKRYLRISGEIDRRKLGSIIFSDALKRTKLDKITNEYVVPKIKKEAMETKEDVVLDVPLLFESKLDKICDMTIGVIAEEETEMIRISERDMISEEDALKRLNTQKKNEFFKINCDYCISNEEDDDRYKQVSDIFERKEFIK